MAHEADVNADAVARAEVVTVYAVGLFQGLALVAFPAASSVLTGASDYDLSSSQ